MPEKRPHFLNRMLAPLGLRVSRVAHPGYSTAGTPIPVRVGRFDIQMYPASQLCHLYRHNPAYSSEIGQIAVCVAEKYPGLRVVDVGANVGDTLAVIKSHINVPVLAIEGDEMSYRLLESNAALFPDTEILKVFLGEKEESLAATVEKAGWNATILPTPAAGSVDGAEILSLVTLDKVMSSRSDGQQYKLLKVDTEGFDLRILRGAIQFLRAGRPVVFFEYNRPNFAALGEDGIEFFKWLGSLGYSDVLVWDPSGRFVLKTGLDHAEALTDLDGYIGAGRGVVSYLDFCVFHASDGDLASKSATAARLARARELLP